MKIVVSPAKSLDYKSEVPTDIFSTPLFLEEALLLNNTLEKKSKKAIGELMHISDTLATLNYERYKAFTTPFTPSNARPAVYAFNGDVYTGLDAYTIPAKKIDVLNDTLRILSGMYGVLKPLDLMQPYRLEMGTKLKVNKANDLYAFWGDQVTEAINNELQEGELFVNLASQEYFKVINTSLLKTEVISPIFKDFKNGKLKIISFFAKKARGSMVRYIIDHNIQDIQGILGFDYDGYSYSQAHTEDPLAPVFIR